MPAVSGARQAVVPLWFPKAGSQVEKMRKIIGIAVVLTVAVAAIGLALMLRGEKPQEIAPVRPVGNVPPDSAPAATVNGETIPWGELTAEVMRKFYADATAILDEQIRDTIVAQEAKKKKVTVTDEEVEARVQEYDKRLRSESGGTMSLEKACAQEGQSMDVIRQELRMRIAEEKLIRMEHPDTGEISDAMIKGWEDGTRGKAAIRGASEGLPAGVAAVVNGEEIPRDVVVAELLSRLARPTIEAMLDEMITDRLVAQKLKERGLSVSEADVNKLIQAKREMMRQDPAFYRLSLEQYVKSQGKTMRDLENQLRRHIALSRLFESEIPEEKLKALFEESRDGLSGRRVRASHIVAMVVDPETKNPLGPGADAAAQKKIEEVRKKLASGMDFAQLAKKYSEDPISAPNGGDLGFFLRRGYVVAGVADVAFEMKKGEVSPPFKTKYGYHIVKVTDVDPGKSVSFSNERLRMAVQYVGLKANEPLRRAWLKRLREGAKIETFLAGVGREVQPTSAAGGEAAKQDTP